MTRTFRAMMDQMLNLEGFAPVIAPNGQEALRLLKTGLPADRCFST